MAITATDRGTGGNNSSEASTTITPGSNLAANSTGVLVFAADNANGNASNFPTSITDSVGNIWYKIQHQVSSGAANQTPETAIYASQLATAFTTSNSMTFTYSAASVTAKAWTLTELAPATGNRVLWKGIGVSNTASGSATPTIGSTYSASIGDAIIGGGGAESGDTWVGDSDTSNGSWSTKQSTGFGSGATGMSVISQAKIQTTTVSTQTYNPTLTAADVHLLVYIFQEADAKCKGLLPGPGSSSASFVFNPSLPLTSGSGAVFVVAVDNAGANGNTANLPTPTITDSAGNTWTMRQDGIYDNGAASAGAEIGIYTSILTANMTISSTITVTFTGANVAAKTGAIWEFSDATAYSASGVGTGATTGTPSVTTSSITNGHYVVGVTAGENDDTFTGDSDTTNGSWSVHSHCSAGGGGASSMSLSTQYKKVTATATQTYNPTCTSCDTMIGWADMTAPAASTQSGTNQFFIWGFD